MHPRRRCRQESGPGTCVPPTAAKIVAGTAPMRALERSTRSRRQTRNPPADARIFRRRRSVHTDSQTSSSSSSLLFVRCLFVPAFVRTFACAGIRPFFAQRVIEVSGELLKSCESFLIVEKRGISGSGKRTEIRKFGGQRGIRFH